METSTLLIRHLPSELSESEKDDLLRHFGAVSIRLMGTTGPMKHTAFAGFPDHFQASKALTRLHQLDILGSRLKVEFAEQSLAPDRAKSEQPWKNQNDGRDRSSSEKKEAVVLPSDDNVYQKWSISYPRNPRLHYLYPPPTVSILTNIANALASYPKFYVQVLHLMNKMNLPAPFGALTSTPPIPADLKDKKNKINGESGPKSSSSESEIESEGEEKSLDVHVPDQIYARKRKRSHKKAKLMIQPPPEVMSQTALPPELVLKPSEVFEQIQEKPSQKRIQLKLPTAVSTTPEVEKTHISQPLTSEVEPAPRPATEESSGFGRIEPIQKEEDEEMLEEEDDWIKRGFISRDELEKGRLPFSELKELSVFKRYDKGEPSCRLYLKNLAKQVSEKDLRYMYGRFIDVSNSEDLNIFDVRVMKEGRMKGQAFVTLPSEEKAIAALELTNGYIINGKPLVVQFARSAKQK